MKDSDLEQLIHDLSIKYGYEATFKKKLNIVLKELLTRYEDLDSRYPVKYAPGRPKKDEVR